MNVAKTNEPKQNDASEHPLSSREQAILRLVVKSFIDTAGPIGSRFLAKRYPLGLSAASIRNTLSDLEELGYLDHPYTSAGRVPTELGYRAFVDELMESPELTPSEKQLLKAELDRLMGNTEELLREGSRVLGRLTNLLGVVLSPKLSTGVLERLEVVPLSMSRVMVVISVRGGLVRTIVLEIDSGLKREDLERVMAMLNERLAGLTLEEIRRTYVSRLRDIEDDRTGVVRLFLDGSSLLFSEQPESHRLRVGGAQNILLQPEFQEPADLRNLIELVEDEENVVNLLEGRHGVEEQARALVTIGRENSDEKAEKYSIVTARYKIGETVGTVGVIGPMRMDYARVVALVENMAALISQGSAASRE
jgi:heat-inducible transcriptional repressor